MSMNTVNLAGGVANTTRSLSPEVWKRFPVAEIQNDKSKGFYRFEDWSDMPLVPTLTTQIAFGKYKAFASAGTTMNRISAVNSVELWGGTLGMTFDTDADDAAVIAEAYPSSFRLSGVPGTDGVACFEACVAYKNPQTTGAAGVSAFIGMGETDLMTLAVALPFNAGDPITNDGAMIGFRIEEAGGGVIDTVYSDRATSFTNIGDTEGGTFTAYTFRKLGFVYDPNEESECITFYANGVKLATKLTRTALKALTNLDANPLGLLIGAVAGTADTGAFYTKWVAWGQVAPQA
jgi:hypothetical protein